MSSNIKCFSSFMVQHFFKILLCCNIQLSKLVNCLGRDIMLNRTADFVKFACKEITQITHAKRSVYLGSKEHINQEINQAYNLPKSKNFTHVLGNLTVKNPQIFEDLEKSTPKKTLCIYDWRGCIRK